MLFELDPVEAIRLRVAAVTMQQRQVAMRRAWPRPVPLHGLQVAIWGDPVPVGGKPRQKAVAKRAEPLPPPLAASVFTWAWECMGELPVRMRRASAPRPETRTVGTLVRTEEGTTRHRGLLYGAAPQPTEEEIERERARRARQKPPKPVRKARTRGRKLLDLIGGDDGA